MPNWKIHLEVGKRLLKKTNFNDGDKELFLLGNILPDINNCFIVKDISTKYNHSYTHYNDNRDSYKMFYNLYHDEFYNPLILGYFIHLYTDYFWNNNFYTTFNKELNKDEKRELKQNDFKKYNSKYINNRIEFQNINIDLKNIKLIDRVKLNENDLRKVENFLQNQKIEKIDYKFYNEHKLDKLLDNTIELLSDYMKSN